MRVTFDEGAFLAEIDNAVSDAIEEQKASLIRELCKIGEECVNRARISEQKGRDYQDQSGNLRSSVGYILIYDGEIVEYGGFQGQREGADTGRDYARSLAEKHPNDIALIIVAGMHYAEYVAAKGYDVLDTAEVVAERLCKELNA